MTKENNKVDINKHEMDIDTLKKQNVNDLLSIKEIYSKLEELGEKITKIKYIDNTLVKKIKKEYENLNKIILDENIQVQLDNKIDEFNLKLTHDIETINSNNSQLTNNIETINSQLVTIETNIREYISIENFPRNSLEKNDTQRFVRAIDYCVNNNHNLKLANNEYIVDTNVLEWIGTFDIVGEGIEKTKIKVSSDSLGGTIINTNETVTFKGGCISNLTIDGCGIAETGIKVIGKKNIFHKIKIINCTVNCMLLGYTNASTPTWETQISECFLCGRENGSDYILPQYALTLSNSATDNYIINTIVTNTSESPIRDRGSNNRFENVHTYGYYDENRPKFNFLLEGSLCSLVNCQFDTPKTAGVYVKGYSNKIVGCNLFWTSTFPNNGNENLLILDNNNNKASGNILLGNNISITTNLSNVVKLIGKNDYLYFQSLGNSGNGGDNGNNMFIHPNDNSIVVNVFGKWYNTNGVDRSLVNKEINLTLENGWEKFDTTGGSYGAIAKINSIGNVELKGRITGGTATNGTTIFKLSSQYAPAKYVCLPIAYRDTTDNYKIGELGIGSSGIVQINGIVNCKYLILDGITIFK